MPTLRSQIRLPRPLIRTRHPADRPPPPHEFPSPEKNSAIRALVRVRRELVRACRELIRAGRSLRRPRRPRVLASEALVGHSNLLPADFESLAPPRVCIFPVWDSKYFCPRGSQLPSQGKLPAPPVDPPRAGAQHDRTGLGIRRPNASPVPPGGSHRRASGSPPKPVAQPGRLAAGHRGRMLRRCPRANLIEGPAVLRRGRSLNRPVGRGKSWPNASPASLGGSHRRASGSPPKPVAQPAGPTHG